MKKGPKTARQLERYFKGVANHHRISILLLVGKESGITLENIAEQLNCNFKTMSDHTRRLAHAGLINKTYKGTSVMHSLSPYGTIFYRFVNNF